MTYENASCRLSRRRFIAMTSALLAMPSVARSQSLEGRRIAFLVGTEGSGGYEAYSRLLAKHLAIALPAAQLTVEVVAAADGRLAAKRIAEAAPGDLTIGLFETALLYSELESDDMVPISLADFNWIGKMAVDERVLIASTKSNIVSIEQLAQRTEPAFFPASTIVSRSASESFLLNALLKLPIKPVPGYDGGQRALAMLSGEAQLITGSYPSQKKMLDRGEALALLRLNEVPHPSVDHSIPLLRDLAPEQYEPLVEFIELSNNLGRWVAAPPSIVKEDLAALRAAFDTAVSSPAFLAEAAALDLAIEPLGGEQVQQKLTALLSRKSQLRDILSDTLDCGRRRADGDRSC